MNSRNQIILYIEDDENDVFLFKHAFTQAGLADSLIVLSDGKQAIDYLARASGTSTGAGNCHPSLVLLDLNLPHIDGLDVLRWIRAIPQFRTLPVLVLTSSNQNVDVQRAYQQGANGFLVKPGKIDEMIAMAKAVKDYWLGQNQTSEWVEVTPGPDAEAEPPHTDS